jgi:hypothetical protein
VQGTAVLCYSGDENQEKEMGGECGTWGRGEKEENIQCFSGVILRKTFLRPRIRWVDMSSINRVGESGPDYSGSR